MLKYLLLFSISTTAFAENLLTVDRGDFTLSKFSCNRTYLAPDIGCRDWNGRVALNLDLNVATHGFFRNHAHFEGTRAKVETVGYQYELGTRLPWGMELGLAHHSQHRMDAKSPHIYGPEGEFLYKNKFPVEDSVFLRFKFAGDK